MLCATTAHVSIDSHGIRSPDLCPPGCPEWLDVMMHAQMCESVSPALKNSCPQIVALFC